MLVVGRSTLWEGSVSCGIYRTLTYVFVGDASDVALSAQRFAFIMLPAALCVVEYISEKWKSLEVAG